MFDILLRLVHTRLSRKLVGWIFTHMSFAIPVDLLRETETLLAFYHPKPTYPFHIVLVPKQAIPSLMEFDPSKSTFLSDLFTSVQSLVAEFKLPAYLRYFHLASDIFINIFPCILYLFLQNINPRT